MAAVGIGKGGVSQSGKASGEQYVELHCHSAYSFLDGVSLPDELARRAGELGYAALALTDHNSVSGSMELAQAAATCGVRAIHGAEVDVTAAGGASIHGHRGIDGPRGDERRHLTLLVRDARGWRNLCRLLTRAHAHTREVPGPRARRAVGEPRGGARAQRGTGVPHRLRRPRRARRANRAAAARRVRPARPARGAATPLRSPRPRAQPGVGRARPAPRGGVCGERRRARPRARPRRVAGRLRGAAPPHHARRLRAATARQPQPRAERPRGDGGPLRRAPGRSARDRAPRR